ncbi:MAG: rhodanese-like domain-containing protein [Methylophilaceae bacterium]
MQTIDEIFLQAKKRAQQSGLPYAGALTPTEAYQVLQNVQQAQLVDVRSTAELDLGGKIPEATHIEWAFYPGMIANQDFAKQLEMQMDKETVLIFMCRTGGRSHNAAAIAAKLGFAQSYNMLEGFEGEANAQKQRTLINGWKHTGLPWSN